MFKKLKDKLAEEVKSSPQRIQQFAQAAQAAVTSASSSISDITNSDLFSIGDNDNPQNSQARTQVSPSKPHNTFQDVNLMQSTSDSFDYPIEMDQPRQRRLSNSSFASDVSFRLPSYETPSMYHLQSDVEVSASEADERGFSGGPATLDRVTKEQLYSAYKRTQERYTKYRTQYSDLARHYKLLERENAKARSVLVETQDKALRRISELKEQCSLEQSAKAHLEKAMRFEIEEKNIKIDTLNTKIRLLQSDGVSNDGENKNSDEKIDNENEKEVQLINLESESRTEDSAAELTTLTNRIEKMEMLLYKYKESLKSTKEKNSQITAELQKVSLELESKNKEIEELKLLSDQLNEAKKQVKKLNDDNETLQNQVNTFDFNKTRELSTLELDLNKANEEIAALQKNIDVFHKREEEYAISLAENKLSIHKELESKETEIKSLKDHLSASKQEIQSLNIVLTDYKTKVSSLEEDKTKLQNDCAELSTIKTKFNEMDAQLQELSKKCHALEQLKTKADEEYKCLELQMKQETAEKLAMIDRNTYLESRNSQLTEDITKKNSQIGNLENDLKKYSSDKNKEADEEKNQMLSEISVWKEKCGKLESEIQEERVELVKLQEEIEKLLANHELIQTQNAEFRVTIANLTSENNANIQAINAFKEIVGNFKNVMTEIKLLRNSIADTSQEVHTLMAASFGSFGQDISEYVTNCIQQIEKNTSTINAKFDKLTKEHKKLKTDYDNICNMNLDILRESDKIREQNIKLTKEVETSQDKLKKISDEYEAGVKEIDLLKAEIVALSENCKVIQATSQETQLSLRNENKERSETFEKFKSIELEKKQLQDKLESLEKEKVLLTKECGKLKQEHTELNGKVSELMTEITSKTNEVKKYKSNQESLEKKIAQYTLNNEKISQLNKDKQVLEVEIKELKNKNNDLSAKLNELHALEDKTNEFTKKLKELDELKTKNKELNEQLSELEDLKIQNEDLLADLSELNELRNENDELIAELSQFSEFKAKHKELGDQLNELNQLKHSSKRILAEMNGFKDLQRVSEETIYRMSCDLESQSEEIGEKLLQITELEEKNRNAVLENTRLKAETSKFIRDINQLESELDDIQKSHAELEKEKNRLNNIIEKLEANEKAKHSNAVSQNTQTDENSNNALPKPDADMFENKWVLENKQAMTNTASLNLNKNVQDESFQKYSLLKISYDELKDENKRLQTDIEGLQSYLTKISKENSTLNDKLREVIATSEHCADDAPPEFKELRNEMKLTKEKLNDLMRENSLLIEENLELKDQLQPQNYSKAKDLPQTTRDNNNDSNNDKYDNLVKMQNQLQQRNTDLEQMNKSMNGNVMQLQDKNERLRLSNEKLERRLDEALVSLRHLHSLQENTELEYLRNILYEYLTGSGSHSVTLAKVLSAIVKFDDSQTQLVLQKEKERQGFLRQLGLI